MNTSESISKIIPALLAAQHELPAVAKDKVNPHFRNKYADINAILAAVVPVLNKHGIVLLQPTSAEDGKALIETRLLHSSGEWIGSSILVTPAKNDPQGLGGAITYGRRFALQSLLALEAEDDDGNTASYRDKEPRSMKAAAENFKAPVDTFEKPSAAGFLAEANPDALRVEFLAKIKDAKTITELDGVATQISINSTVRTHENVRDELRVAYAQKKKYILSNTQMEEGVI